MTINPAASLKGEITIPGDKSISHRAVMFGAIAEGKTEIEGFLPGADCLSTIDCFRRLGIEIEQSGSRVTVFGKGLHGLSAPGKTLDVGNSGTTMRLLSGILAGQPFDSELSGDASIQKRPMGRILKPLCMMGAEISGKDGSERAPLSIHGRKLKGIRYDSPIASAQVKSCVLLAGLYAEGETSVREPVLSRDHTERMLRGFGADVTSEGTVSRILPERVLLGQRLLVPGDISSAAYFIAAALLVPGGEVLISNVGINPTRDGILKVAEAMGGSITLENRREISGEPVADLLVRHSPLHGTIVSGELIPTLIDEIPMIAVMGAFAEGDTVIRDAAELRVKETDRVETVVSNLRRLGIEAEGLPDGMVIHGGRMHGGTVPSFGDHRIAMAFSVAGLIAEGAVTIEDAACARVSYPGFYQDLLSLCQ